MFVSIGRPVRGVPIIGIISSGQSSVASLRVQLGGERVDRVGQR
jgi:hypothetical protein